MESRKMNAKFGETLRKLRINKGLSQNELAEKLFVDRSTIARWENGSRMPDAAMLIKIAECLDVDIDVLISVAAEPDKTPNVIILDDEKIILDGSVALLKKAIPDANIIGFTVPAEALEFAKNNRVDLAFLDIRMGHISGLDVCRELLKFNPKTNVIFLTAYTDYSLDAWGTGASGFMLKPLTEEGVRKQLAKLRYPLVTGGRTE